MSIIAFATALAPALTYPLICWAYFSRIKQRQEEIEGLIRDETLTAYLNAYGPTPPVESFRRMYDPKRYLLPVALNVGTVLLVAIGFLTQRGFVEVRAGELTWLLFQIPPTMMAAFIGAYLWSHYEMLRRSSTVDLTPNLLMSLWLRLLLAGVLGYAASLAFQSPVDMLIALAVGVLPIAHMNDFVSTALRKRLGVDVGQRPRSDLTALQGITPEVVERLAEDGICTVQHLALANPVRLLQRTYFEWTVILDWVDQAILYVYVGDKLGSLRPAAMRGAIEVAVIRELMEGEPEQRERGESLVECLSERLGQKPAVVRALVDVLYNDPLVWFIWMVWNEMYGEFGPSSGGSGSPPERTGDAPPPAPPRDDAAPAPLAAA
jgi:hypothetical protein